MQSSDLKVLGAVPGSREQEPSLEDAFIDGFGAGWNGTFEWMESSSLQDSLEYAINNGFHIYIRPTSGANTTTNRDLARIYFDNGLTIFQPAGSNNYRDSVYTRDLENNLVVCGAGISENMTGYKCHFYDEDIVFTAKDIVSMTQCGASYTVSKVQRISSTILRFKLSGISTLAGLNAIGLVGNGGVSGEGGLGYGIPVYFTGLTGSDIVSLPNGLLDANVKYVTALGEGYFEIAHTTSSGSSVEQDITGGTMVFGNPDTTKLLVITYNYNTWTASMGVRFAGVTGFTSNPDGVKTITHELNNDSYGSKFLVTHSTGGGAYSGTGGTARVQTSSNGTPRIAGQFAKIMTSLGCSAWDAIERMKATGSENGVFATYNGYGVPDISSAIAYTGTITADTTKTLGAIGNLALTKDEIAETLTLTWGTVTNALKYNFYLDDELFATVFNVLDNTMTIDIERKFKSETGFKYQYSAVRGTTETALSTAKYIRYFKWNEICYKT